MVDDKISSNLRRFDLHRRTRGVSVRAAGNRLDENGQEVVVAFGITPATKMNEIDREKATLLARANLAAYLNRGVISGSVVIKEWRHVGGDQRGGMEIVAVEWSEANARSAAGIPR
jgi:hypothetical protein